MSILSTLFGIKTSQNDAISVLDSNEFKAQTLNKKVQLIDVRTANEFNSGHIKNAKNIDIFSSKFNVECCKFNKENAVYLYCQSGARSRQASTKLAAMGFIKIYDLRGGISNYR